MSFNCVSKYGLVGGGVFLPYDVQKIIADIWLRMRYREMYGNVTKQLIREIGICGSVCNQRMIVKLRNRFKYYDEAQLIWLLRMFAHSIYWHSTTWIDEDCVLNSPFSAISQLSYQDLLAFHYYITVDSLGSGWPEVIYLQIRGTTLHIVMILTLCIQIIGCVHDSKYLSNGV